MTTPTNPNHPVMQPVIIPNTSSTSSSTSSSSNIFNIIPATNLTPAETVLAASLLQRNIEDTRRSRQPNPMLSNRRVTVSTQTSNVITLRDAQGNRRVVQIPSLQTSTPSTHLPAGGDRFRRV